MGWIEFFLAAVSQQAEENTTRALAIQSLHENTKFRVPDILGSKHDIRILDALFVWPVFSRSEFVRECGIPQTSGYRALKQLEEAGILVSVRRKRGRRGTLLVFQKQIEAAEGSELT